MELKFKDEGHSYTSIADPSKKWTSVTTLYQLFKEPFNQEEVALACSEKKKSKWFGLTPAEIIALWDNESERGNTLGTWYHNQREDEVASCETIQRNGIDLPIYRPMEQDGYRISPDQSIGPGIYPEHFVYLKSAGICGQADRVEVVGDEVHVYDYKTNKKIDTQSFVHWKTGSKKMYSPIGHLDDCSLIHFALQLSIYMYIILKHNHNLKPGKLILHHITFEVESVDEYDFPTYATDLDGNPIVKEVIPYEVPYLKKEVMAILRHIQTNPKILDNDKTV